MPPVPAKLREMLKDYPELIARLQEVLDSVVEMPSPETPPIERAAWKLEGRLTTFVVEASNELEAAKALGDVDAVLQAGEKVRLMRRARSPGIGMLNLSDLLTYFNRSERGM